MINKISVITPSFNQAEYIAENIESVKRQNYPKFEHIIIDGGSTDGTLNILKKYNHVIWISRPDKGQANAVNEGFRICTGSIICWLNSDDYLCDNSLKIVNEFFSKNPDKYLITGQLLFIEDNKIIKRLNPEVLKFNKLLDGIQCVLQPSTFFRKEIIEQIGYLDTSYHYTLDHEYFIRVTKKFKSYMINEPLACFRIHNKSKTVTKPSLFLMESIKYKIKHKAKIFTFGNIILIWRIMKIPFKKYNTLRTLMKKIRSIKND